MADPREQQRHQHRKDHQPDVTPADLTDKVSHHLDTLLDAIKTGKTERLTSFLTFSTRFHRYSPRNQELIYEQRPGATQVASYPKWKQEGYQVASGEKGIRILYPIIPPTGQRKRSEEEIDLENERDPHKRRAKEIAIVTRYFRVGSVFDVSQLTPDKRPPEFFTAIQGDHEALHQRLVEAVTRDGIKYQESEATAGARGYSAGGLIVVQPDQTPGNKAAVTTHEWAHEIMHKAEQRRNLPKQVKECHAEATAYVVLSHFGVTIPYSAEYLVMWGNDQASLQKELDLVTGAASQIISKLHALEPGEQHFHDQAGEGVK